MTTLLPVSSRDEPLSDEQLRKLRIMAVGTKKSLVSMMYELVHEQIDAEISEAESEISRLLKASLWAQQPQRAYHSAIVAYWTPKIREALRRSFSGLDQAVASAQRQYLISVQGAQQNVIEKAVNAANLSAADRKALATSTATAAIQADIQMSPEDATQTMEYIYGDSYITGVDAAMSQLGEDSLPPDEMAALMEELDMGEWAPGVDSAAAAQVADGGLAELLDQAGITIEGIFGTILDMFGNALADGLQQGLPSDAIVSGLEDIVGGRAEMITSTSAAMAQSAATMETYQNNGIQQYEWLAEDTACPECADNADNGPYEVPDGGSVVDIEPAQPEHPNCKCCYLPVVPDESGDNLAPSPEDWAGGTMDISSGDGGADATDMEAQ